MSEFIVRRLTPLECERLQGFPDNWTSLPEIHNMTDEQQLAIEDIRKTSAVAFGKPYKKYKTKAPLTRWYNKFIKSDSHKYQALGNSIATPQWEWITQRMAKFFPHGATLGSLFDGIGGFPLVWERTHGVGTAVWASEIEVFPILVTMYHFPEVSHEDRQDQ